MRTMLPSCSSYILVLLALASARGAPTPAERAAELVANMTLSEQIALLHGTGWGADDYVGKVKWGVKNTQMMIPDINLNDGPQGFRCNGLGKCPGGTSTQYPSGLTVAASWDPAAAYAWGAAMGKEFAGKGANVQLGPGMCLARVPRNGRNFEYMSGEDPYLGREMTPGTIKGIQDQGVVANAKHFILNNQETNRNSIDVQIDERTLHEMYLPPFEGAVDAGVGSIMCSYNKIMGKWSCEQNSTLNTALRTDLGFEGWVMSDWRATHSTSIDDGLDQEMPGSDHMNSGALSSKADAVRRSALRVLTPLFAVGAFDSNQTKNSINTNVSTPARMETARQLAENSTVLLKNDGLLLPLRVSTKAAPGAPIRKIVFVGSGATNPQTGGGGSGRVDASRQISPLAALTGAIAAAGGAPGSNSNCSGAAWEQDVDFYSETCQTGSAGGSGAADCCAQCAARGDGCLYFSYKESTKMCWFKTCDAGRKSSQGVVSGRCRSDAPTPTGGTSVQAFSNANDAKASLGGNDTVAIVIVGQYSAEGSDRKGLGYSDDDNKMIADVAAAQPGGTIVVATAPGAVLMPWKDQASAVLLAFYPGQEFGPALANLLLGAVSPSGRLPLTIPNKENEMGWSDDMWPGKDGKVAYSEKLEVGYRWYDAHGVAPAYAFGHGLTYSSFEYGALQLSSGSSSPGGAAHTVAFTLTNTGTAAAAEVAQLYIGFPGSAGEPPRVLRGFRKVALAAGASVTVSFPLGARELSVWDADAHAWSEVAGTFTVSVGASSRDLRQNATLQN
eukprot:g4548.t1